jgi:pimeloyl-ACP methyl ester carboxylesterase
MQPATLENDLAACNAYQRGATAAATVRQPTLIFAGSDDKLTKAADGKALADMMPDARFHLISGSGHMLMVENPVEIAKEIGVFYSCNKWLIFS